MLTVLLDGDASSRPSSRTEVRNLLGMTYKYFIFYTITSIFFSVHTACARGVGLRGIRFMSRRSSIFSKLKPHFKEIACHDLQNCNYWCRSRRVCRRPPRRSQRCPSHPDRAVPARGHLFEPWLHTLENPAPECRSGRFPAKGGRIRDRLRCESLLLTGGRYRPQGAHPRRPAEGDLVPADKA